MELDPFLAKPTAWTYKKPPSQEADKSSSINLCLRLQQIPSFSLLLETVNTSYSSLVQGSQHPTKTANDVNIIAPPTIRWWSKHYNALPIALIRILCFSLPSLPNIFNCRSFADNAQFMKFSLELLVGK